MSGKPTLTGIRSAGARAEVLKFLQSRRIPTCCDIIRAALKLDANNTNTSLYKLNKLGLIRRVSYGVYEVVK